MADLNGSNNTFETADFLDLLALQASSAGFGTVTQLGGTDTVGLLDRYEVNGGIFGPDSSDMFWFSTSGVGTLTIEIDASRAGTYANFLSVVPYTGVSKVIGPTVATWYGGQHATSSTISRQIVEDVSVGIFSDVRAGEYAILPDFSESTIVEGNGTVSTTWVLDGSPVLFEITGFEFDGNFNLGIDDVVELDEVSYSFTVRAAEPLFANAYGDGLLFFDTFGFAETHTGNGDTDTYVFDGLQQDFVIQGQNGDVLTVSHSSVLSEPDTLIGIDRFQFDDATIAFDIDGRAGQAYRLYEASFDRIPDAAGLGFWIGHYDAGNVDLVQMAEFFMQSPEFTSLYGAADTLDDEAFLTVLYNNVLDRDPDTPGFAFWRDQQDKGLSRAEMLQYFSESTENYANTIGQIEDGIFFI